MPKLHVLTSKKLIKILEGLGFVLDHQTGSHLIFYDINRNRRTIKEV
jgi:predicted RNA binding protein YcfA (HicA-like mRNA interferase family)